MGRLDSGIDRDVSGAAAIQGFGMDFEDLNGGSFQVISDGLTGTVVLEANNDPQANPDKWMAVSIVTFEALTGALNQVVEVNGMRSAYYRLVATIASGTGHIKAIVIGKVG
jgi:hypothetical protein